jgi:hypothetical protein
MHHPLHWLPTQTSSKIEWFFAYLLEILVFFGEIFLYLKLKWSFLGSPFGIFILWKFDDAKEKTRMAIPVPMFYTPVDTKNVFTMLRWSLTSKIFSTSTLHATHYESQEALLHALQ